MESLGFGARLWLSLTLPWRVLADGVFASKVQAAGSGTPEVALAPAREVQEQVAERDLSPALQLLSILQREGRFVDFVQEDLSGASDADIGAAAVILAPLLALAGLEAALRDAGRTGCVQRVGSMITLFFTDGPVNALDDISTSAVEQFGAFWRAMREGGVYLPPSQYEAWFISAAHDENIIDETVEIARQSLA